MVGLLPAERVAELAEGPVTIDIDATDVEVYGSKKRGVAYNYQGQRAGPAARGLVGGDRDPAGRRPAVRGSGPGLPVRNVSSAANEHDRAGQTGKSPMTLL